MQGKKTYQEKLFTRFLLSLRVPKQNFNRRLKSILDLDYFYKLTELFWYLWPEKYRSHRILQSEPFGAAIAYNLKTCLPAGRNT